METSGVWEIPWKEYNPRAVYAIFTGIFGIPFLIPIFLFWAELGWGGRLTFAVIGGPLTAATLWLIFAKPKNKSYKWVGPGRPGPTDVPPGVPPGEMEMRRLMHRYGPEMERHPGKHSLSRSETTHKFTIKGGEGDWLIKPREVIEEEKRQMASRPPVELIDLGTSFILEAKGRHADMQGVKVKVTQDDVWLLIPAGNDWLDDAVHAQDDKGNRMGRMSLSDDVVPNRAWVDAWDGALRVHMPVDADYFYDGVSEKVLEPVTRDGPPPVIEEVPLDMQNRPSICDLRWDDRGETVEVSLTVEDQVLDSFSYNVEPQRVVISLEEMKKKTSPLGIGIRVKHHTVVIELPVPVLAGSANWRREANTFYIYLHKA